MTDFSDNRYCKIDKYCHRPRDLSYAACQVKYRRIRESEREKEREGRIGACCLKRWKRKNKKGAGGRAKTIYFSGVYGDGALNSSFKKNFRSASRLACKHRVMAESKCEQAPVGCIFWRYVLYLATNAFLCLSWWSEWWSCNLTSAQQTRGNRAFPFLSQKKKILLDKEEISLNTMTETTESNLERANFSKSSINDHSNYKIWGKIRKFKHKQQVFRERIGREESEKGEGWEVKEIQKAGFSSGEINIEQKCTDLVLGLV